MTLITPIVQRAPAHRSPRGGDSLLASAASSGRQAPCRAAAPAELGAAACSSRRTPGQSLQSSELLLLIDQDIAWDLPPPQDEHLTP